jgi:hypothetical protein
MTHEPHSAQSDSIHGELLDRIRRDFARILHSGPKLVALVMREFISWLQFSPASALFGHDRRQVPFEHADLSSIRSPLHCKFRYTTVVDLVAVRSGSGEWNVSATTVSVDIQEYPTRPPERKTDDDRK